MYNMCESRKIFRMRKQNSHGDESVSDTQIVAQLRALRRDDPNVTEILVSCSYVYMSCLIGFS
jgi:hypothetical protein